jgi:hypothetical protein
VILTLLPSRYTLDVLLPLKILLCMVLVSVHGRDEMGREKLRIIAEDWSEPDESEYLLTVFISSRATTPLDHFLVEWDVRFPCFHTNISNTSKSTIHATLEADGEGAPGENGIGK